MSSDARSALSPWARRVCQVLFGLWVPAVLVPCAYFLAWHELTLPDSASPAEVLRVSEEDTGPSSRAGAWTVLHILSASCGCSGRILARLEADGPRAGFVERVIVVGGSEATSARLRHAGFLATSVSFAALQSRYRVEAAPAWIVADAEGRIRYSGGYGGRSGAPPEDDRILAQLRAGADVEALPVFGCALGPELQGALDPLGLKY